MPTQVTSVRGGTSTTVNYRYDGFGQRYKKEALGGMTTYYIGDHFEIKGGTQVKYIFAGNLRVAQVEGITLTYIHKDHLGSSTVMTDDSGVETESTQYMPFGSTRPGSGEIIGTSYNFTDQEFDTENGLYNYGARLYDPVIGRFISADTIVPKMFNPQSLNRYSYCLNNPLIYADPSGHEEEENDPLPSPIIIPGQLSNGFIVIPIGLRPISTLTQEEINAVINGVGSNDAVSSGGGGIQAGYANSSVGVMSDLDLYRFYQEYGVSSNPYLYGLLAAPRIAAILAAQREMPTDTELEAIFNPNIGFFCGKTTIINSDGDVIKEIITGNNTIKDSNGPIPAGIYPIGKPRPVDPDGDANRDGVPDGIQFGPYFIPIKDVPGRTGIGWHGGRSGPTSKTEGCLRSSNSDIKEVVEIYRKQPIRRFTILPD